MSALLALTSGMIFLMGIITQCEGMKAEQASELQNASLLQSNEWSTLIMIIVSSALLLSILIYAVINCTDCYKSEVSTDCHPATASGGRKWGGAGGFSDAGTDVNSRVLGAGFTGDVVVPENRSHQPLPYTMIPTQVPEAQGFCGYAPAEPSNTAGVGGYGATGVHHGLAGYGAEGGLAGYGGGGGSMAGYGSGGGGNLAGYGGGQGGQWGQPGSGGGRSQHLPGAHVSPMGTQEREEPPPYFAPSYR